MEPSLLTFSSIGLVAVIVLVVAPSHSGNFGQGHVVTTISSITTVFQQTPCVCLSMAKPVHYIYIPLQYQLQHI